MLLIQLYYNIKRKIRKNNLNLSYEKVRIIINFFYKIYFKYLFCIVLKNSYIYLIIKDNNFKNLFIFLKNSFFFSCSQLLDLIIVDRLEMKLKSGKRFNYVYVLLSVINNIRVFVSGFIGLFEILPSLTSLFKSID
jgi:NADH:ubiquinone oxidoreductase subunit C